MLSRRTIVLALLFSSFAFPARASDNESTRPSGTGTSSAAPSTSQTDSEDGLQISVALGGGYFHDDFEQTFGIFRRARGTAAGGSGSGHLAVGYAVKRGLNVGGLLAVEQVVNPKVSVEGADVSTTDNISVGTLVMLGPYIDWNFVPETGWHLLGAVGGARITIKDDTGTERRDVNPVGGGALAAIGYKISLADDWSLGAMARFAGATLFGENLTHRVVTSALLVSLTYQ